MTQYYACRNKKTGLYLPIMVPAARRGHTHTEPTHPDKVPPRLHRKEQHAKSALRAWLAGKIEDSYGPSSWESNVDDQFYREVKPQPDRIPEDWEVIPVYLIRKHPNEVRLGEYFGL
ncbi:MAG: hypothetical protein AB7L09_21360 [Nitrospira sp.]